LLPVHAEPGDLDSSFGGTGINYTPATGPDTKIETIALDPDGGTVTAGTANGVGTLMRYRPDGALDKTFAQAGFAQLFNDPVNTWNAVVVQRDGKIIAAGTTGTRAVIARYHRNGRLDDSFNTSGFVVLSLPTKGMASVQSLALQRDGRIVFSGNANFELVVGRLTTTGALDTTFSTDGYLTKKAPISGNAFIGSGLAVQEDGKILATSNSGRELLLYRFLSNGATDLSFNRTGLSSVRLASDISGTTLVVQSDGAVLAAANVFREKYLVRWKSNGVLDDHFGAQGRRPTGIQSLPSAQSSLRPALMVQPDGHILMAGEFRPNGGRTALGVQRFSSAGESDGSFGDRGVATSPASSVQSSFQFLGGAALRSDGKITLVGLIPLNGATSIAHIRLNGDGKPDSTLATSDALLSSGSTGSNTLFAGRAVAIQADGKAVVAGVATTSDFSSQSRLAVSRYTASGQLDPTFSKVGTMGLNSYPSAGRSLVIQPDQKIVVAGSFNQSLLFVRLLPDGSLDSKFGSNGTRTGGTGVANAIASQTDGKIIAVGTSSPFTNNQTNSDFVLERITADGRADTSFGNLGRVRTSFGGYRDEARGVVIQPDGKIVVAGFTYIGAFLRTQVALARYNVDGTLDTSFGTAGMITSSAGACTDAVGSCVALQRDGRILVGGSADGNIMLQRYGLNGTLEWTRTAKFGTAVNHARALAVLPDGKIIVTGQASLTQSGVPTVNAIIVRFNADGTLDKTLNGSGAVLENYIALEYKTGGSIGTIGFGVTLQDDGKVIIAGAQLPIQASSSNGFADPSFFSDQPPIQSITRLLLARFHMDDEGRGELAAVNTEVPDQPTERFGSFYEASLNNEGRVIFAAQLTDGTRPDGVWSTGADGLLSTLVQSGDAILNEGASFGRQFSGLRLADSGAGIFQADAVSQLSFVRSVQCIDNGRDAVTVFARHTGGYQIANALSNFTGFSYTSQNTDSGEGYFAANLVQWTQPTVTIASSGTPAPPKITAANDSGVWRTSTSGVLTAAVREGEALPATMGKSLRQGEVQRVAVSPANYGVYHGHLTGRGVTSANVEAVLTRDFRYPLPPALIARSTQPAANLPGATFYTFLGETVNRSGQVLLWAQVSGDDYSAPMDRALFSNRWGALQRVIRSGDAIVKGVELGSVLGYWLCDDTTVVVLAQLSGPGVTPENDLCVFSSVRDGNLVLAREGDAIFAKTSIDTIQRVDVSADGRLALLCSLTSSNADNQVLLTLNDVKTKSPLMQLLRKGSPVPGGRVPIYSISLGGQNVQGNTGSTAGMSRLINEQGQVATMLIFADNTQAVYVTK
jgi:uncharacterized delta-60 repeat protein